MTVADLVRLRADANAALKLAIEDRREIGGPVNWGNLSCVSARECRDDEGGVIVEVIIDRKSVV